VNLFRRSDLSEFCAHDIPGRSGPIPLSAEAGQNQC
jgi:hypothetical protein